MAPHIRLSPKHGVNPSLALCFFCHNATGEIILPGRLTNDQPAPRSAVWDHRPCPTCRDHMTRGVILISVKDGEEGSENPYRTGGWVVLTDDAITRLLDSPIRETILRKRIAFVPDTVWSLLGLPALPGDPTKTT